MIHAGGSPHSSFVERITDNSPKSWASPLGPTMDKTAFWPMPAAPAGTSNDVHAQHMDSHCRQLQADRSPVSVLLPPVADPLSLAQRDRTSHGGGTPNESEQDRSGRPKRKRIAPEQLAVLLDLFNLTDTPSYEQRERVASNLGMSNREVQVWFQNRRAKERNHKQKQQLQEHRERLERVESAQAFFSGQKPSVMPSRPLPQSSLSSPAGQPTYPLPLAFDGNRRRSLSTSALELPQPDLRRGFESSARAMTPDTFTNDNIGPSRPRYSRHHTFHPTFAYPRPSSARSPANTTMSLSPPIRARQLNSGTSPAVSPDESSVVHSDTTTEALLLPLPQPRYPSAHSRTSSYGSTKSSSSTGGTVADRRQNRLPPIRMLLDIADRVSNDLSPFISGAPSSSLSTGLYSPFSDLQLETPGSLDGRQADYFGEQARAPPDSTTTTASLASYTFGRTFQ